MQQLILKSVGAFVNLTAVLFPTWNYNNSFKFLSKVQRGNVSEKGAAFLASAEQTFFEINGASSVIYKWGNGPKKVLFLHGWMSNSQRWMPYHKLLDLTKYTVYALDAPGHGLSKTNYLNLEMYRKSIEMTLQKTGTIDTVVCHSFSNTALTYSYLVHKKINVKKIVVMGSPSGMDAIFIYFKEALGLSKKAIKILDKKINEILKVPHQEIMVEKLLREAPQPKLLVHDKGDTITPFTPINKAIINNPTVTSVITTGLKHDLKSEEVYDAVLSFIES